MPTTELPAAPQRAGQTPRDIDEGPTKASLDQKVSAFPMTAGGDDAVNSDSPTEEDDDGNEDSIVNYGPQSVADSAWAVCVQDNKVLLVKRSANSHVFPGSWCLPGGRVEANEAPAIAAIRELLEETCLAGTVKGEGVFLPFPGGIAAYYAVVDVSGELAFCPTECQGALWFAPTALPGDLMAGTAEAVKALFNKAQQHTSIGTNFSQEAKLDSLLVYRLDRGEFRKPSKTPEGYWKGEAYATRTGVFPYVDGKGGTRRELRLPEHVFDEESMQTLAEKPVTDQHPAIGLLDSKNAARYSKGVTGLYIGRDDIFLTAPVTIFDAALIADVESGRKPEVSCGYNCELLMQSGVYNGEPYDAIQTKIRYNHLAVVPKGRAGSEVRLRLDASEQYYEMPIEREESRMAKINIDGAEVEVTEPVAAMLTAKFRNDAKDKKEADQELEDAKKEKAKTDKEAEDAKTAFDKMKEDKEKAEDAKDKAEAKADALTEQLTQRADGADFNARVQARLDLLTVAASVVPAEVKLDSLDDKAIKTAVIMATSPDARLDGKSDAYLDARYDAAVEALDARSDSSGRLHTQITGSRTASATNKVSEAAVKMRADSANAWQTPLGKVRKGR
jgi:8-oxo-dGTP pyrophosphatase MutT (NUDIX family)